MSITLSTDRHSHNPNLTARRPLAVLKPPSARDIDIYKRVKVLGCLQQSVAHHYRLHTTRVSQIVKKVRRWIAAGGPVSDPQVREHAAQQNLSRATHILRLKHAIGQVTLVAQGQIPAQISTRSRYVGGTKVWHEETSKLPPEIDLKAIRLLLRLTESLQQLEDREDGEQTSAKPQQLFPNDLVCEPELIDSVFEHLCRWRASAEQNRRLPPCPDIHSLVTSALASVFGADVKTPATPASEPEASSVDTSSAAETPDASPPSSPPEPSAHLSLNMSALPPQPNSTTDAASTPCDQPAIPAAEKSSKHERSADDPIPPPAGSKPAPGASPTDSTSSNIAPSAPPITFLSALACALLLLSGPLTSALGGFPQPTAKVSPKASSEWKLERDSVWKVCASKPSNRPRNRIDLVTFSKPEQIHPCKAATSGRGLRLTTAIIDRGLPAPKDRGHNQRHGSSPRPHWPRFPPQTSTEGSMNAVSSLALLALFSVTGDTVLLQFSSQRCTNCQAMQPVVNQLAQAGVQVHSIDVDQQQAAAQQFQIRGVPTYVAFSDGRELARIEGVTTAEKLASLVGWDKAAGTAAERWSSAAGPPTRRASEGLPAGSTPAPDQTARAATVRLKVEDATGYGYGTGTIIDTHDNEALAVTCGHLFRESKGAGKITADLFASGSAQTVEGQLIAYDLDRDIALVSLRVPAAVRPVHVAPPGYNVRPGDRAFTVGCDKGADPSIRSTHITAVNKYKGKPNFTAAGQPIDGRSGGGLFSAEGHLIGICNAADPADDEGLYAGLASIHWQLDQIGQSEIYQRAARVAAAANPPRDSAVALVAAQTPAPAASPIPPLPPEMPAGPFSGPSRSAATLEPIAVGDDTEIVFIVRSKRNPAERSEVYVVDQAAPDLVARITHAARASGAQRAAVARSNQPPVRTASAGQLPGAPPIVRGQSGEY